MIAEMDQETAWAHRINNTLLLPLAQSETEYRENGPPLNLRSKASSALNDPLKLLKAIISGKTFFLPLFPLCLSLFVLSYLCASH